MKKKLRLLCVIFALVLGGANMLPFAVYAEELAGAAKDAQGNVLLTSVEIGGLDKPQTGVAFDEVATVTSAQGISWNIPVIWVNSAGAQVHLSAFQDTYLPIFVFYLPKGYAIAVSQTDGRADIKIPAFVNQLYGKDAATTVVYDSSKGISYVASGLLNFYTYTRSGGSSSSSSSSAGSAVTVEKDDGKTAQQQLLEQYCDATARAEFNAEFLEYLVNLIRNEIEPKAVSLLREKFRAYNEAVVGKDLSSQIGLYIYHDTGNCNGQPSVGGAMAYVAPAWLKDETGKEPIHMTIGVNTKTILEKNPDTGKYELTEKARISLENSIVHEMMHAFMFDYTRAGMVGGETYPTWFIEGIAAVTENNFMIRYDDYLGLAVSNKNEDDTGRSKTEFTQASIFAGYTAKSDSGAGYDVVDAEVDDKGNASLIAAYVSGYLACMYLGAMASQSYDGINAVVDDGNGGHQMNFTAIRNGLSYILEGLHEGRSLDTIIADISSKERYANGLPKEGTSRYENTDDYTIKFIKGPETLGDNGKGFYPGDKESLEFCEKLLTYLEGQEWTDENGNTQHANGSVLNDEQNYVAMLKPDQATDNDAYKITKGGFVKSDADENAEKNTGGKSDKTEAGDANDSGAARSDVASAVGVNTAGKAEAASAETASAEDATVEVVTADVNQVAAGGADVVSEALSVAGGADVASAGAADAGDATVELAAADGSSAAAGGAGAASAANATSGDATVEVVTADGSSAAAGGAGAASAANATSGDTSESAGAANSTGSTESVGASNSTGSAENAGATESAGVTDSTDSATSTDTSDSTGASETTSSGTPSESTARDETSSSDTTSAGDSNSSSDTTAAGE